MDQKCFNAINWNRVPIDVLELPNKVPKLHWDRVLTLPIGIGFQHCQ